MIDTKQKIIRVATRLFAQKGFEGVSIREISRKARVNLAAINYYFQTKEQLYMAVIIPYFEKMRDHMAELARQGIEDEEVYIQRFVACHFQILFQDDKEMELIIGRELSIPSPRRNRLIQDFFSPNLHALIGVIQRGINRGRFRKVDTGLAALSLVGMTVFYANKRDNIGRILGIDAFTDEFRDHVVAHTAELFLRGIKI